MPIIRDAISSGTANPGTSLTISHVNAGNLLVVGVGAASSTDIITGVTYNSVAMIRTANGYQAMGGGINRSAYMYYLLTPSIGTANIVISAGSSLAIESNNGSYRGVLQNGQPDATVSNSAAASTTVANTLTTIADNCIHMAFYYVDGAAPTSVTNGTLLGDFMAESNPLVITPVGAHTMTGSAAPSQNWATCGASFSPITGGYLGGKYL